MKRIIGLVIVLILAIGALFYVASYKDYYQYISYGDSITAYDGHLFPDDTVCAGYQRYVLEDFGYDRYLNVSVAGATLTRSDESYSLLPDILSTDNRNAKICTILLGTNDYYRDLPIGKLVTDGNNYDEYTFIGAYQTAIEHILNDNSKVKLILITPPVRSWTGGDTSNKNSLGYSLEDYVNAIIEVGEYYNLPVCDLYHNCGITEDNLNEYTIDGLHPNNEGHALIGEFISRFIRELNY